MVDAPERPVCELSDVCQQDGLTRFTVNTKFLQQGEKLPFIQPNAELDVRRTIPLNELIQEVEHSGCASGRARAIVVIAENCSTNTITRCPAVYRNREQPIAPDAPQTLRTHYPPMPIPTDNYLPVEQEGTVYSDVENLVIRRAIFFCNAGHSDHVNAAKDHIRKMLENCTVDNLPPHKRQRLMRHGGQEE